MNLTSTQVRNKISCQTGFLSVCLFIKKNLYFTACKVTFFNGKFTLKSLISYLKYICWRKETKNNSNVHEYHQEFAYDTFHIHLIWGRNYFQLRFRTTCASSVRRPNSRSWKDLLCNTLRLFSSRTINSGLVKTMEWLATSSSRRLSSASEQCKQVYHALSALGCANQSRHSCLLYTSPSPRDA